MNYIDEYSQKIESGEIIAGKWIKLLLEQLTNGVREGLYFYDQAKADAVI